MSDRIFIKNIGLMLSGELSAPILSADAMMIENGKIALICAADELPAPEQGDKIIDAQGCAICPGLIDNHSHPTAGDFTPRQSQTGWIESNVNGGVTTLISAGEAHYPGRPRDVVGLKALSITAQRAFSNIRPGGMKVIAGAPMLEPGMTENDFRELAQAGITIVGEVGLGAVKDGPTGKQMIGWARKYGMTSMTHCGGPSIPGSGRIGADVVIEVDADVIAHVNGGPTALPDDEILKVCTDSKRALEIVHNGNLRTGLMVLDWAMKNEALDRVLIGTDSPAGSGVQPLGMIRTMAHLASIGGVAPELTFCFASGNVAKVRNLTDRGILEVGRCADIVFLDKPDASAGDTVLEGLTQGNIPGIGMVMIDGKVVIGRSRNTPPALRAPVVL